MTVIELEWGPAGAAALALDCAALVVVDVLSFTTCVSVAVDRGVSVWPHPWRDGSAATRAAELGAVLAAPRGGPGPSLSPVSLSGLASGGRLVLPSPNGSQIAAAAGGSGGLVLAASLRNAAAVGGWLAGRFERVGLVPAGERWPDGSLRPAYEDLVGAGAVIARIGGRPGADAEVALAAYRGWSPDRLLACRSGRELVGRGFRADVVMAAAEDVDAVVPVLTGGAFREAT